MILQTIHCDRCGRELPKATINAFGHEIEAYINSRCYAWDLSSVYQHLCRTCALTLENELIKIRLDLLDKKLKEKTND